MATSWLRSYVALAAVFWAHHYVEDDNRIIHAPCGQPGRPHRSRCQPPDRCASLPGTSQARKGHSPYIPNEALDG